MALMYIFSMIVRWHKKSAASAALFADIRELSVFCQVFFCTVGCHGTIGYSGDDLA